MSSQLWCQIQPRSCRMAPSREAAQECSPQSAPSLSKVRKPPVGKESYRGMASAMPIKIATQAHAPMGRNYLGSSAFQMCGQRCSANVSHLGRARPLAAIGTNFAVDPPHGELRCLLLSRGVADGSKYLFLRGHTLENIADVHCHSPILSQSTV